MSEDDKEKTVYVVDLRYIRGIGDFTCPHKGCGSYINPDDKSTHEVYGCKFKDKEKKKLEEMDIRCTKCQSDIRIVGFERSKFDFFTKHFRFLQRIKKVSYSF